MYNKFEFFAAAAVSLFIGIGIGYTKAREMFLEAMIRAMPDNNDDTGNENKAET